MNENIERTGKVIGVGCDGMARISLTKPPSCSQCGSRGTCGSQAANEQVISLRLPADPRVGQEVIVATSPNSVVIAALLGYAMPAISLLIGAMVAEVMFGKDEAAAIGAVLGLVSGLWAARVISNTVLRNAISTYAVQVHYEHSIPSGERP